MGKLSHDKHVLAFILGSTSNLSNTEGLLHTMRCATEANFIDQILICAEDADAAQLAQSSHYESLLLSSDRQTFLQSVQEYLAALQLSSNLPSLIVLIPAPSSELKSETIDAVVQNLLDSQADSALSVRVAGPALWSIESGGAQQVQRLAESPSPLYMETGEVYALCAESFLKHKSLYGQQIALGFSSTISHFDPYQQLAMRLLPVDPQVLVLDFDGVFTDNTVIVMQNGQEAVICSRSDGWGLSQLKKTGFQILVLSKEENPVVRARCEKLGIECLHNIPDKLPVLREWLSQRSLNLSQAVYVGNDINDLACLQHVGCGVAVQDAHPYAKAAAKLILKNKGGHGALREIAELLVKKLEKKTYEY